MMDLLMALARGIPATLIVSFGAFAFGLVMAVPLVLMRRSRLAALRIVARVYIDVVRGVPPIVWLFIIFFGLGSNLIVLSSYQAAILGMGLVCTAYLAEIYRGGFLSVPTEQREAAIALGMSRLDTLRYVLAPQVLRVSIPSMATFLVSLLKDTSVASTIGVRDVMMLATQQAHAGNGSFVPFILAALLYILLSIPVAMFARAMDAKRRSWGNAG